MTFKRWSPLQPYFKSRKGISWTSLCCGVPNKICHQFCFPLVRSMQENKKKLPMSYIQGQIFSITSTKRHVPHSRNWLSQRHCYYEAYTWWVSQSLSQRDLTLSFPRSQKSFVINERLVNLLVKSACRKSHTAHLGYLNQYWSWSQPNCITQTVIFLSFEMMTRLSA